jgi:proline iminopeptidase
MVSAYYRRLTSDDASVRARAALAWSVWEGATSKLHPDPKLIARSARAGFADALARIECHYFVNGSFLRHPDQLLDDVEKIRHIPGVIIQGRYDVVCPPISAWDLHRRWPEAEFHIVADAGHSAMELGTIDRLVEATDRFRDLA